MDFISSNRDEHITCQIRRVVCNDSSFGDGLESFVGAGCTACRTTHMALVLEIKSVSYMKGENNEHTYFEDWEMSFTFG